MWKGENNDFQSVASGLYFVVVFYSWEPSQPTDYAHEVI